jgi:hypothetical protein
VDIRASRLSAKEIISESRIDIEAAAVDAGSIDASGDVGIRATNIEIQTLVCQKGDIRTRHHYGQNSEPRSDGVLQVHQIISKGALEINVNELRIEDLLCGSEIFIRSSIIKGRFISSNLRLEIRCDNLTAVHIHSQYRFDIATAESLSVQELSCESDITLWSEGSVITAARILAQETLTAKCDRLNVDLIHSKLAMDLTVRELHVQTLASDSETTLRVTDALTAGDIFCGGYLDIQCRSISADRLVSKGSIHLQVEGNALKVRELYAVDQIDIICREQSTGK